MISKIESAAVRSVYTNDTTAKEASQKKGANISKQGDMDKIDRIKEALDSGEYKVDLQALSEKIAQELL